MTDKIRRRVAVTLRENILRDLRQHASDMEWSLSHVVRKALTAYFEECSHVPLNQDKRQVSADIDQHTYEQMASIAERNGVSLAAVQRYALSWYLDQVARKG